MAQGHRTGSRQHVSLRNGRVSEGGEIGRREILAGAGAVAIGGLAGVLGRVPGALAQGAKPHRIDVHHHISPPAWINALKKAQLDNPPIANWTVAKSLDDMDKAGIATAITSPTSPQVSFLDKEAAMSIARESNEWATKMAADHPGRFGVFAMLPMPNVDVSVKEAAYAFDTLKVDGIGMLTSYGDKWLGHKSFEPLWEELNRRKATVYTHPTSAKCCVDVVPGIPDSAIEWGTDTMRTIGDLMLTGTSQKYKDINWIFSHGGGALVAFAERFQIQIVARPPYGGPGGKFNREIIDRELKRFHYDTAQVSNAVTIGALAKLVGVSQIVYGTDYPYREGLEHTQGVTANFSGADLAAIDRGNALRILPHWRA